ncbi:aldo/keto reductase [uncultured Lactobacillus sp.]|uniref:aldo/keto reductase n=1 Tax=uncultured Lactobacillus sp. TaxID=153152 RepID=UPI00262EBE6C|nr:aldo/keto reductase [uncultured Lactobacillus sp.]
MVEIPKIKLNDGNQLPLIGLDASQIADREKARQTVEMAIKNGYRLIDAGANDDNQIAVGEAIKETGIDRKEMFIITRVNVSKMTFEKANKAIEFSLKELDTNYIDLVVLSHPYGDIFGAWNALSYQKHEDKVKSIGLANFYPDQYMNLELSHEDKPALNEIEINPWFQQTNDIAFFEGRDIAIAGIEPFAQDKDNLLENKELKRIAEKYHKKVSQVILRWLTQRNILVTPQSEHEKEQKEYLDIFDFNLTEDEMIRIKGLDKGVSQYFDHRDPAVIEDIFGESLKQLRDSK